MALFTLTFNTGRLASPIVEPKLVVADNLIELGRQLAAGMLDPITLKAGDVEAAGTVVFSTSSGTLEILVNGVTFSAATGGGDTANAAALAVLINASVDALISGVVTATSAADGADANLVVTATRAGLSGNYITLTVTGTGVTGPVAGRLEGGTETLFTY